GAEIVNDGGPTWIKGAGIADVAWGPPRKQRPAGGAEAAGPRKQKAPELLEQAKGAAGTGAAKPRLVQQLTLLFAMLALSMAGGFRSVIGVVFVAAITPAAAPRIEAAIQAGKNYREAAMELEEKAEGDAVDAAAPARRAPRSRSRAENIMKYELEDSAADIKCVRARVPLGKGAEKKSERAGGKARLQRALTTTAIARELDGAIRSGIARRGGWILIGAAPRGVLEKGARALLSKLEPK
ncbi:unnamed protein product, partial [Prorocentrum cordatum]